MNAILTQIHAHASVRHYRPDPVPREMVEQIVEAGQRASTSSNLQAYSVIAVTRPEVRAELAHLCGDQAHVAEAPVFLAWCADLARLDLACVNRGYAQVADYVENFLIATIDTAIAAQNAALAAESLGLGICYIGSLRNHPLDVIRLLALPRLTFPLFGLTLGWPARPPRPKPRLPLRAVLHWERYQPDQNEALAEYDRTMIATGIYQGRQVPVPGRPEEVEDYGWQEHSARRVAQVTRPDLRAAIESQGFGLK